MGPKPASRAKLGAAKTEVGGVNIADEVSADSNLPQEPETARGLSTGKLKPVEKAVKSQALPSVSRGKSKGSTPSPGKPAAKAKEIEKNQVRQSTKSIDSFFNAATQNSKPPQSHINCEPASPVLEKLETIYDDSDTEQHHFDSKGVAFARDSSTALALRKRQFKRTISFENDAGTPLSGSQKFRKSNSGDRTLSLSIFNEDQRPWTDQFAPLDLSELAVHKRKVADVRQWLEATLNGRRHKVLMLKGAAGTGKTTTINLLAKDLGIGIIEWNGSNTTGYGPNLSTSASARFEEFIGRAGRSGGLQLAADSTSETRSGAFLREENQPGLQDRSQILLVEEFPNTFAKTSSTLQSFRATIAQYLSSPVPAESKPSPVVMIISETLLSTNTASSDSFTAHRLLGPDLIAHPFLDVIEFNPVAPTFLTKALETIIVKEARISGRRKTPGPQVLKHLVQTGDIRSAVSSLEFLCLRGDDGDTWSSKVAFTKPKQNKALLPLTKSEEEALKLISNRESTLGIFHAVGKVVYNKREQSSRADDLVQPPAWIPQHHRSKVPETDVDSLMDELGTDTSTFLSALHENYALSCLCDTSEKTLDSLVGCMDNLSDADLLGLDRFSFGTRALSGSAADSLRQDEIYFQVAVRGLLFCLPCPVRRDVPSGFKRGDAHRMFYPTYLKLRQRREEIESTLDVLASRIMSSNSRDTTVQGVAQGVDGWHRNKDLAMQSTTGDVSTLPLLIEAKKELLVDRLPYMFHMIDATGRKLLPQSLQEQLRTVTHMSGSVPPDNGDDVGDDEAHEPDLGAAHWATDRPDTEPKAKRTPTARSAKISGKTTFETGELSSTVERRVEGLVLEDDDIVDD